MKSPAFFKTTWWRFLRIRLLILSAMIGFLIYGGTLAIHQQTAVPPARPSAVPAAAEWAGGVDGGVWIGCKSTANATDSHHCTIYQEADGSPLAVGDYALRKIVWNDKTQSPDFLAAAMPSPIKYKDFDGTSIFLENNLVLVPQGMIDYPTQAGHGKRQFYHDGTPQGAETVY